MGTLGCWLQSYAPVASWREAEKEEGRRREGREKLVSSVPTGPGSTLRYPALLGTQKELNVLFGMGQDRQTASSRMTCSFSC